MTEPAIAVDRLTKTFGARGIAEVSFADLWDLD